MKYKVTITETLEKEIEVEAASCNEAEIFAQEQYYRGDHILDSSHYRTTEFRAVNLAKTEQCAKCNKEFEVKDLFLQWCTFGETYICEDCIRKHKQYTIDPCYAEDSDITFVFAIVRVPVDDEFIELSQMLIGYHYGKPDGNEEYRRQMLQDWLTGNDKIRKDLLRQNFNENNKNEEVLY